MKEDRRGAGGRTSLTDPRTRARYEARAVVMKALAHATRLFMVDRLGEGELCVSDLTEMVGADASTVSRHLSVLKNAGIVRDRKSGTQVFYSVAVPCVYNWYTCVEGVLDSQAKAHLSVAGPHG